MTTFELIVELLAPLGSPNLTCRDHPEQKAVFICIRCGRTLCRDCMIAAGREGNVFCLECAAAARRKTLLFRLIALLKLPAFWIILMVFLTIIAYFAHWTNPTLQTRMKNEAHRPWFQRYVGKMLLEKALRNRQRAAALRILHRQQEAAVWSRRAAGAFARAADYWQGTAAFKELKIAEAVSVANSGDNEKALAILQALKIPQSAVVYPAYCFYLGKIYEKLGKPEAALTQFKAAMTGARIMQRKALDNFVDLMSGDRRRAKLLEHIRNSCGLKITVNDLKSTLRKYNIEPKAKHKRFDIMDIINGKADTDDIDGSEVSPEKNDELDVKPLKKNPAPGQDDFDIEIIRKK